MKTKRILSMLLTLAMLLGLLPAFSVGVSAEDATYTWEIDEYGTLTVSGTGEISFGSENSQAWASKRDTVNKIVVNDGITVIGSSAFREFKYATSVSIPDSVKSIGQSAFEGCTHLQELILPEGLETIGYAAFVDCSSIAEITIPASVTTLDRCAFSGCTALEKAVFECSVSTIPDYIFSECISLEEVTLPVGLTNTDGACFMNCTSLKSITLPDTMVATGSSLFSGCTALQEINTENILEYGARTFENCSSLKGITINETVKNIPSYMFSNSGITSIALPENLQKIEGGAFSGCTKLESINLPENLKWEYSGYYANLFSGCTALKEITIPKNLKSIDGAMFKNCTSLEKVTLHDDIEKIEYSAFEGCTSLKNITLPKNLKILHHWVFKNSGITEITIPNSVKDIYGGGTVGPFSESALETVYFEEGRNEIPDHMFMGAAKLKNIDLSNIEKIGDYAFAGCSELVPVLTDKITEYSNYAFEGCASLTDFAIPAWMEKIPDGLLSGTGIGYIVFPDTVKEIGKDAYKNCENLSYIEFSDSITDIGSCAFYGCTALDEVDIPGTVKNIGQSAFEYCSNLKELKMHKGTQTLGGSAFAHCNLSVVRPSATIRVLNDNMFYGNPVIRLIVPRFCSEWDGWGNVYNDFGPGISYVPANVKNFDIYVYENATIHGVTGTAAEEEAIREAKSGNNVAFKEMKVGIEALSFDKKAVDISLDETYDAASIVTIDIEDVWEIVPSNTGMGVIMEGRYYETDSEFLTFTSDNEGVATVDETGYVHGVGYGTANITISCDSGITDTLTVNVVRPSVGVSVSSGYEKLSVGETITLTADTIPSGYEESYVWSSSDEAVAAVTQEGVVTAAGAGTAVISVQGEYSGKTASCAVVVTSGNELPYRLGIDGFVIGCNVSLKDAEAGGNVVAALYDSNNTLLAANTYPAEESIKVDFVVEPTVDLTGANIKVFWWEDELMKPLSMLRLIEIE